ncbi:TPA: efflux RND transporter periplasmic adaptor subunit [Legionella pneumophila subsp. pneumophila]|uniref:efflux RND transporter periplasmic adaptor subunit n=1 Tax=Legionella pneumophila TaxID=446 RepID=UPI000396E4A1|nr:efflux RND transporter periplasmic adaptor subunit [Legionella pneumophila]ERI46680.1 PTS cellobiose transporter subunit IIB [Legionella pneumophila str. Leg01/20]MCH9059077.1 efflux RND transporter periplasmic adaptor subunit [Legionella pneumophila serogroup 1]MCH9062779.1 efflux RND transporter periplasmic adaptor subunit [Legionella pneumophila serogroup 1]MCH9065109.1 efflux RND transporter periplasmic adaptor subunit [Legionella pneumophila serogroup 1]MCH9069840.1 efflux RND transpor
MNFKMIIKGVVILSLLSLLQVTQAQQAMDNHGKMDMKQSTQGNEIVIDPARLQAIGITSEPVRRQVVEKIIRTVGRVEADERLVAHIHVRFDGWIENLFINFTGEKVKADQALFTVYSPELVATQQEYLLALNAQKILSKNTTSSAARGAQSAFQAAHQRLLLWGISEKDIEQLRRTGKITRTMTIHSPIQGTVLKKMALVGMRIEPGDELYTIADLSRLWVLGDIYEYELPYIRLGQMADLTLTYLPNELFKAKLDFIYPTIDMKTRTAKVRFEVDNQKEQLKPGMYVNLELKVPLGERLVVPKNAVLLTGERAVVFIYHGNGKIEWRDVTLGVRAGDLLEIIKGVKEGDQIITSANFLIDSESQLKAAMGGMQHQ